MDGGMRDGMFVDVLRAGVRGASLRGWGGEDGFWVERVLSVNVCREACLLALVRL